MNVNEWKLKDAKGGPIPLKKLLKATVREAGRLALPSKVTTKSLTQKINVH